MEIPRCVYLLLNTITGKCYVGSSGNPNLRFSGHLSNLRRHRHPVEDMQSDYDKYGECFQLILLEVIETFDDRKKEYEWMRKLNTTDRCYGYNYKDNTNVANRPNKKAKYLYEYQGRKLTVGQLSQLTSVSYPCLMARLRAGWDAEKALNTTFDMRCPKQKRKIC